MQFFFFFEPGNCPGSGITGDLIHDRQYHLKEKRTRGQEVSAKDIFRGDAGVLH